MKPRTICGIAVVVAAFAAVAVGTVPTEAAIAKGGGSASATAGDRILRGQLPGAHRPRTSAPKTSTSLATSTLSQCNSSWSPVASSTAGSDTFLLGTSALTAHDQWAAGGAYASASSTVEQTYAQHWDGSSWSITPSPNSGSLDNELESVASFAAGDANGSGWSVVSSPNLGTGNNECPPSSASGYTAVLTASVPIAAIVNEVAPSSTSAKQSTAYNTFASGAASLNLPLVESAGSDGWSTGEGIMNTGSAVTTVTVTYFDTVTGAPVGTPQSLTLQPNAFWGLYQPAGGLPAGTRASAQFTTTGQPVAVICNESNSSSFMSYGGA